MNMTHAIRRIVPMGISYLASGGSLLASSFAQLITFAILARSFGAEQFALFLMITAVTNVAAQICGLGVQECLVRRVAREHELYPVMLGHSLILSGLSGLVLLAAGIATLPFLLPLSADPLENFSSVALLLLSNILLFRFIALGTQSYVAHSNFVAANTLEVAFALARTGAAVAGCLVFGVSTVAGWATWHFAAHLVIAAACLWPMYRLGPPRYRLVRQEVRLGVLFSTQFIFKAVRQNLDLLVLSMVASAEVLGSYGVARRILDSSFLSVEAMNRLIYPGSAVAAADGLHNAFDRVRKVLVAGFAISVCAALTVYVLAPYMPLLFGEQYVSMVALTRLLCWTVVPIAVAGVVLEAFGAAGRQGVRAAIYNGANIVAACLMALAALYAGVTGAIATSYVVEIATATIAWFTLLHAVQRDRMRRAQPAAALAQTTAQ